MTYQPQKGDYGCVSGSGVIPFLIQLGTLTKYNHAFIYLGDGLIIEAMPKGVQLAPVSKYKNIAWNQHEIKTDEQREAIVKEAMTHLGNKYSFIDYLAIALRTLRFNAPDWLIAKLDSSPDVICSQLVAAVYRSCGFTIDGEMPEYYCTPSDLVYRLLYI